jgi:N-acetylglucosaminyldiphosphoundecaprenol N-acetyl-beta-D-mannosaminyltransferase
MKHREKIGILNVNIHNVATDDVLARIGQWLSGDYKPRIVCTPNVDFLIKARKDKEFQDIINQADLAVPDGMGVVYASWLLRKPLRGTVSGRLLAVHVCRLALEQGRSIFFLGGRPGAAQASARRMKERFPGLDVAGHSCPRMGFSFGDEEDQRTLDAIRQASPDILLVSFGAPKQEKWIMKHKDDLGVPVSIGVGYAFDVLGGHIKEPPRFVNRVGLEWLFRLVREPRRLWRRYIPGNVLFLGLLLRQMLREATAFGRRGPAVAPDSDIKA